ncbi:MAG: peptide-methionine (R)-S-oxide reductase MsrB [Fimbriimonadaceae bacterium]
MMKTILFAALLVGLVVALTAFVPQGVTTPAPETQGSPKRKDKLVLTEAEWKKRLTPKQYDILRKKGTEAAFCGRFIDNKQDGVYSCAGCGLPLFKSDAKFDSGTGWPSFFQPYSKENVWTRTDRTAGMVREEVLCARCDGHLGHVFNDGPKPSGLRFCINSEVLTFKKK